MVWCLVVFDLWMMHWGCLRLPHRVIVMHPVLTLPKSVHRVCTCRASDTIASGHTPASKPSRTGPLNLCLKRCTGGTHVVVVCLYLILFVAYLLQIFDSISHPLLCFLSVGWVNPVKQWPWARLKSSTILSILMGEIRICGLLIHPKYLFVVKRIMGRDQMLWDRRLI